MVLVILSGRENGFEGRMQSFGSYDVQTLWKARIEIPKKNRELSFLNLDLSGRIRLIILFLFKALSNRA